MRQLNYNHIISLGYSCLPRTILTRQGYKQTKTQGELTLPFDLSIHSYYGLCNIIKSKFKDYCNPDFLILTQDKYIENTKYNVMFNHESMNGNYEIYSANIFAKFIERYEARITNFYRYIADDNILFVCQYKEYPSRLNWVIKSVFPQLTYKIVALNTFFPRETLISYFDPVEVYHKEIDYYALPFPSDNYAWWEPQHFSSDLGKKFENSIGHIISKYVERLYPPTLERFG
ncbi:DUF1796 family putative cysteine peptidase [Microcoleus asticus]|uniref:Papain-like cysteine peptidase n=1 Tax=Microcoleus asticus IPMA8 TaxID=2563858 RepID=A0ABX2D1Z0_9CYAN|nr:hypothetical protein [Microcoleus asticus IPMA8]